MRGNLIGYFFFLILLSCSCEAKEKNDIPVDDNIVVMEQLKNLRYLALGDSYTIGEGIASSQRYPAQIRDSLAERGFNIAPPEIIAVTGWTTSNLKAGIKAAKPEGPYDLVSLLIGVNNQYQGLDINIYSKEFEELINQSIRLADNDTGRIIVLSIPDWGVTPFAGGANKELIAKEIDQYNAINKEIALKKGITWIDITGISRMAEKDLSLIANDGLHPSGKMYSEWVGLTVPEIVKMLGKNEH
jgi:lysophospholipase L1-like esterase